VEAELLKLFAVHCDLLDLLCEPPSLTQSHFLAEQPTRLGYSAEVRQHLEDLIRLLILNKKESLELGIAQVQLPI